VQSTVNVANTRYNGLKESNSLVRYALENAEKTVDLVKPMVNNFGTTLAFADTIACQSLENIENSYPAMKMSTEELSNVGWQKYEEVKQMGVGKVNELKEYGYKRLDEGMSTPYVAAVVSSVNTAVDLTEHTLNHFLPPTEGEEQQRIEGNVFQKVSALSELTRRRLYRKAMSQVDRLEKVREEKLAPVITYASELKEYGIQRAVAGIEEVKKNATWFWEEMNKVDSESKGVLLLAARGMTQQAIRAYEEVLKATDRLPEGVKNTYNVGVTYSKDVYTQLAKADNLKDASAIVLSELHRLANSGSQITLELLATYIPQLRNNKNKGE